MECPDLTFIPTKVQEYIKYLEREIEQSKVKKHPTKIKKRKAEPDIPKEPAELSEPPTTFNLISISTLGYIKRSHRHLYQRQRRGGIGMFDIEISQNDQPHLLVIADEDDTLMFITSKARTFCLAVNELPESLIRSKGQLLSNWIPLHDDEQVTAVFVQKDKGYITILTDRGHLRRYVYNHFRKNFMAGRVIIEIEQLGNPVSACWTEENNEFFIATRQGKGIRFAENLVPMRGCLGIRLAKDDEAVALTPTTEDSGIFMMTANGKGTVRSMSGFSANKSPGSGGKVAMKTDNLIGAVWVNDGDDLFAISKSGRIIRFQADDVPTKKGAVQGVNCMVLRDDQVSAIIKCDVDSM
ncbi:MAG: hypothetical protein B6242_03420 [Anaerolineaceae bacterium 4572_78]|nr:MAG: hypothetical protein B6242_03420 [Anaerolineaceae bacterium 4572_78]